jgi:hypothetical protein
MFICRHVRAFLRQMSAAAMSIDRPESSEVLIAPQRDLWVDTSELDLPPADRSETWTQAELSAERIH